ncbi:MAG TPA: hypothetical protein VK066_09445 [Chloroflexota bacterium]|nr:hypothetical protein [Chloroflexota bacterium]
MATVAGLARWGVRPVLLVFLWPEPDALLPADALLGALLQHAPRLPAPAAPPSEPAQHGIGLGRERAMAPATAPSVQVAAQYALVLGRERASPASPADLATRFDNRYALGAIDLPSTARLRAGGVGAVVACRDRATPPAADLTEYLDGLEAAGVPIRRLALG